MEMTETQKETLKRNNLESNRVTREAIRDALYLLMRKKEFDRIKITEIIQKSGVSRSAFYRNYKTKEDIIQELVSEFVTLFEAKNTHSLTANWQLGFDYFLEHREKLNLILRSGLEHLLLNEANKNLDYSRGEDFVQAMNNGMIYNVIIYWAKCGMREDGQAAALRVARSYAQIYRSLRGQMEAYSGQDITQSSPV